MDKKYACTAGEKSQKARNGKSQAGSGECCAEEGIVYQEHPEAAKFV
ncbi:uncharacterized protein METZ01_LOCUS160190 [marine metagenome]|uniref:Uncharacterized protein n=1 Tax=marine metagenome TaxID=408172 RepID=A0A382B0K6_9ZZZZ